MVAWWRAANHGGEGDAIHIQTCVSAVAGSCEIDL
jgi:hypothetical protein